MVSEIAICWFCGTRLERRAMTAGASIGSMVYSSHLIVSAGGGLGVKRSDDVEKHDSEDCARICDPCIRQRHASLAPLDPIYIEAQKALKQESIGEMLDYETDLIPFEDRSLHFGCWFRNSPDVAIWEKFHGLRLIDLLDRGLRFAGAVRFGEPELEQFLARFSSPVPTDEIQQGAAGYGPLLERAFALSDDETIRRFLAVRPCIFDITLDNIVYRDSF